MPADLSPLWISLKTAGLATIVTGCLGTAVAYWMLGYRGRWKSLIEGILISPLILPPTVVGFLLLVLFGRTGPLGRVMQQFDFTIVFTWYAAVVAAVVVSFPLMYKTTLGAFEQVDSNLLHVARTLGASEIQVFWRVLLPLAMPGILSGVTLAFARALGEFGATLMLAGNIPGQTQTLPMAIYFAVEAGAMQEAWVWTIAIMALSLAGLMLVNGWRSRYEPTRQGDYRRFVEADEPVNRGGKRPEFDRFFPTKIPQTSLINPNINSTNLGWANAGLQVEIQKQLPNFLLNTALTIQHGTLGILGGSGSGKSMTLRCIAGVEIPSSGRIVLNDRILFDSQEKINLPSHRRNIGLVFQNYALFPHLNVYQNIAFGLKKLPKQQQKQRVNQLLASIQMQGLGNRYPHQLSGGQQQRVALARALATNPEALLLDEPFSALDTYLRSQMEQQWLEILSAYRGVVLLVTHNLEEAYRLCETLLVMSGGSPIAYDLKHQIFEQPKTVRVAQLTGCKNFSRAIVQTPDYVQAIDWGISLHILEAIPDRLTEVGIRAHQIRIIRDRHATNTFPCWLAATSETPHRMTLFLKFNTAPLNSQDYHVQAEIFKENWNAIKDQPFPWYVQLDPTRVILMGDG